MLQSTAGNGGFICKTERNLAVLFSLTVYLELLCRCRAVCEVCDGSGSITHCHVDLRTRLVPRADFRACWSFVPSATYLAPALTTLGKC
jgi:hypothetical protein